ncbi:hypothetical protein JCM1840_000729 [Sporobolomyces johnsonii]
MTNSLSEQSPDELTPEELSCESEFAAHLRLYPNDTNFVVERDGPGIGYGTLCCMEDQCMTDVRLGPSLTPNVVNGGVERGFGSLLAYAVHIDSTPEHVVCRSKRIAIEQNRSTPKSSGLSSDLDDVKPRISTTKPYNAVASGSGSNASGSGSSASSSVVPKKRLFDAKPHSSAGKVFDASEDEPHTTTLADKKPKLAIEPRVFAERQNAQPGTGGRTPAEEADVKSLEERLKICERIASELRQLPRHEQMADHCAQLDKANGVIDYLKLQIRDWEVKYGPRSAPAHAARAPAVDVPLPGYPANHAALANVQLLQKQYPGYQANAVAGSSTANAIDGVMDIFGTLPVPVPGGSEDDAEEAYWRNGPSVNTSEDFDHFIKKALEGESFEGNANVDAAAAAIGLKSQRDRIPNMKCTLMPHQIIAAAWMKEQEASKHYGGILADEMGLGKTVEAIAMLLLNESSDLQEKSTLVVAPLALLEQWKTEIEEKTEPGYFSILIYHGPNRKKIKLKHLKKYDVVLTTYSTLVADFPDEEAALKKASMTARKEGGDAEDYFDIGEKGPLLQMEWYRIILDEAQNIRNRSTKTSRAVSHLDGLYRWALTGTPVTNSLADLYPLFRFLQLKPWYKWGDYREHVITYEKREPDIAGRKAQAILRSCMLRRKKDSKLYDALALAVSGDADPVFTLRSDGKELITLPPKKVELHQIEFSLEEREIYDFIEKKAQTKFNKFLKAGTVMKNYSHVLVMLLRLRQVCFHPALVADAQATLERKEQQKYELKDEVERAKTNVSAEFVRKAKKMRLEAAVERCKAEKAGDDARADECSVCLEMMQANEGGGVVTRCLHSFCRTCIEDIIKRPVVDDAGDDNITQCTADQRPCPFCRQPIGLDDLYMLEAFDPTDEELGNEMGSAMDVDDEDVDPTLGGFIVEDGEASDDDDAPVFKQKKTPKQLNRAVIQDSDEEDGGAQSEAEEAPAPRKKDKGKGKAKEDNRTMADVGWMKEQEPSTKMIWTLTELERIFKEHPDDKVLIISSFTTALEMFADLLDSKGIRNCRYQGDMSNKDREEALRILRKSKKCKVMLLSLKCGGVGLTLTRANRVISLDLAWSNAVEQQAFGRVHRIGQEKDVFVDRLTIANTVEQRMFDLQVKKQGLADASLGEGKAQKLGKLTVQDLAMLFGIKPNAVGRWA